VKVGGLAWQQHTGIERVEVQLDGGAWQRATLAPRRLADSWVQWQTTLEIAAGDHRLRVRAVNDDGEVQTPVRADPVPNGSSGWHTISVSAG
jgi:hypothetical protein